ncbi:hypothetical protein BT63DRAFT_80679 [Microthyrium microscopicum]|uniref:Tyrosine specific protein phosphatases domain-containing protein n=1 Tax=Microthyrium microscopicum TaxID=703497 RepID=A0A6A6U030_9PEZI|nr:hypothetical protein BT63DRAFT_80679 [Microthyrium microscopicum]
MDEDAVKAPIAAEHFLPSFQYLTDLALTPIDRDLNREVVAQALLLSPFVPVSGAQNTRDLGLYPQSGVKAVLIFRSGPLHTVPEASRASLSTQLGIKVIFDLRQEHEFEKNSCPEIPGIRNIWVPPTDERVRVTPSDFAEDEGVAGYIKMYDNSLTVYAQSFGRILRFLKDNEDVPIIFHCSGGNDRTGVLSALIMSLAGCSPEVIAQDYLLSRISLETTKHLLFDDMEQ